MVFHQLKMCKEEVIYVVRIPRYNLHLSLYASRRFPNLKDRSVARKVMSRIRVSGSHNLEMAHHCLRSLKNGKLIVLNVGTLKEVTKPDLHVKNPS